MQDRQCCLYKVLSSELPVSVDWSELGQSRNPSLFEFITGRSDRFAAATGCAHKVGLVSLSQRSESQNRSP